ncbi:hypothetical protein [Amycolatopsis taiwanensis]|uniref:hypothetical protein n=1 Tax=Amycolatopsis taiwanensis TaxID=342230 RepID=UPI002552FE6A|nr:hypothetical protein [Amycolatopsis taiwanensis]
MQRLQPTTYAAGTVGLAVAVDVIVARGLSGMQDLESLSAGPDRRGARVVVHDRKRGLHHALPGVLRAELIPTTEVRSRTYQLSSRGRVVGCRTATGSGARLIEGATAARTL